MKMEYLGAYYESILAQEVRKEGGIYYTPPYIGEYAHKYIFAPYKQSPLGKRFYRGKMDMFYFFFHVGLDFLKEKGILAFITSNYYLTADAAGSVGDNFR